MDLGYTLYPPIVDTFTPAFVFNNMANEENPKKGVAKIYFSQSPYNDIKLDRNNENYIYYTLDVIVSYQDTNYSALKDGKDFIESKDIKKENDKYFISVESDSLDEKYFTPDSMYKVQLRYRQVELEDDTENPGEKRIKKSNSASEWSTVTLIRPIYKPLISINGAFKDDGEVLTPTFRGGFLYFNGRCDFLNDMDLKVSTSEYLKEYSFTINTNKIGDKEFKSDIIIPRDKNVIDYITPRMFGSNTSILANLTMTYETNSGYKGVENFYFEIEQYISLKNFLLNTSIDSNNGIINLLVTYSGTDSIDINNYTIRRQEFGEDAWLQIDGVLEEIDKEQTDPNRYFIYKDRTVESGKEYKYSIQYTPQAYGQNSDSIETKVFTKVIFDDITLLGGGRQFNVKYDPNISSIKTTYSESKTDTIGAQYPYIRRNGKSKYKQFSISGLIASCSDEENLFIDDIDHLNQDIYLHEREFRDKIISFLEDGNPKLYRSTTEGNMIIRLMDINLTPNQTLGRLLYSFSATAYEVAECNFDNYKKYHITQKET